VIRELREADAAAVAALELAVNPHQVVTPALVWQRASRRIEREQLRTLVAELDGEIAGYAHAGFEWSVPTPGKGRFWIGVRPERRGRGIGSRLYEEIERHLLSGGAWRLRTWVDADPAGALFLERRGFAPGDADIVSELDLRTTVLEEPVVPAGLRLAPIAEARVEDLYAICAAGELDMPGDEPETELSLADWKQDDFGAPDLSHEGSFAAFDRDRAVSLAFLTDDPERRLGYNQMTATLPGYRRRGLALAVKLASARWAAGAGLERLVTENDSTNAGMLAVNARLGYRPLYEQVSWLREHDRR
jgi:GNAT superfamily N-acetyltransferase